LKRRRPGERVQRSLEQRRAANPAPEGNEAGATIRRSPRLGRSAQNARAGSASQAGERTRRSMSSGTSPTLPSQSPEARKNEGKNLLLSAALAGLMSAGLATACGSDDSTPNTGNRPVHTGKEGEYNNVLSEDSCGGVHCVVLPEDKGLSGQKIYESGGCDNCHGVWNDDYSEVDMTKFMLDLEPGEDGDARVQQFHVSSDDKLISAMVFGVQETHGDYWSSVMPAYRADYSVAELKRTLEHLRTLEVGSRAYPYFGDPEPTK
jgi:hypothetical protein